MADTSVTYNGDGSTTVFNVPFRYILNTHVEVYLNAIKRLNPSDWTWQDATNIKFNTAPATDDAIQIKRVTPGDTRLVDFQNGAVLTEQDLDKAIDQIFFLAQEAKEGFADLLQAEMIRIGTPSGITETDPTLWLDSAIDTMLADATAAALQARVSDIDDNAQAIIDVATRTTDMEAFYAVTLNVNGYITGFAQMNDGLTGSFTVLADKFLMVEPPGTWAATTAYNLNKVVRNGSNVLFKCTTAGTSGGTEPTWDETIGNTTTDATVVWTAIASQDLFSPFSVADGIVTMQNVVINGNLVVDGTITNSELTGAALSDLYTDLGSVTAGDITLDTAGFIKGGQTAYDTGNGFWLGYDTDKYKFSVGDSAAANMTWDGSKLAIRGDLIADNISVTNVTPINRVACVVTIEAVPTPTGETTNTMGTGAWRGNMDGVGSSLPFESNPSAVLIGPAEDTLSGGRVGSVSTAILIDTDVVVSGEVKIILQRRAHDGTSWGSWADVTVTDQTTVAGHSSSTYLSLSVRTRKGWNNGSLPPADGTGAMQYRFRATQVGGGNTGKVHNYEGSVNVLNWADQ